MGKRSEDSRIERFTYRIKVGHIAANPVSVRLEADENERKALARRWSVLAVDAVTADLHVGRWKRDGVRVKGKVEAAITQACVITLEPVASTIAETIDALFVPEGSRLARFDTAEDGAMIVDPEGPDAPETFQGDSIDLGAVCEEFIILAIDPYPRVPGATLVTDGEYAQNDVETSSAFSALRAWKGKQ